MEEYNDMKEQLNKANERIKELESMLCKYCDSKWNSKLDCCEDCFTTEYNHCEDCDDIIEIATISTCIYRSGYVCDDCFKKFHNDHDKSICPECKKSICIECLIYFEDTRCPECSKEIKIKQDHT